MGPTGTPSSGAENKALADMVSQMAKEAVNRGATALMDDEVGTLGVPNPRILIVGCGGSGNTHRERCALRCERDWGVLMHKKKVRSIYA